MFRNNRLKIFGFIWLLSLTFSNNTLAQKEDYNVLSNWLEYTDASNSLYHYLTSQAFQLLKTRDSIISHTKTISDWQRRQKQVKEALMIMLGPFPKKTPLNAVITRKIKKSGYSIENIVFQSQPNFYVTSSLFIPDNLKNPAPAVLDLIGHTDITYRKPSYQKVILNLVKKGFLVLVVDPIGQGERIQYFDSAKHKSSLGGSVREHTVPGVQAFITGSSQAKYMTWDGIRAIDYLLTRKEVDASRIGITGISGGGTQTAYVAAVDDRILAAAPENYITTFERLLQAIGPQDGEQSLVGELKGYINHPDFIEARAPKPTMMVTTTRDFFPIQGAIEAAEEIDRIYQVYNKEGNFYRAEDDTTHSFSKRTREAINAFFQKYLNNPGDSSDLDNEVLTEDELRVTKTGQVVTSYPHAETVFSLNKKEAEEKNKHIEESRKDLQKHIPEILSSAKRLSGYQPPINIDNPVFTGRYQRGNYVIEKYFVKGEGDYVMPYLLISPRNSNGKAAICLNPEGKNEEISNLQTWNLVQNGFTVLIPDLIGTGEVGGGRYFKTSINYFGMFSLSLLVGRSIVGIQAGDVNRLVKLLKSVYKVKEVYGIARGEMTSVLLHAAAFNDDISRIFLENPLVSYHSLVATQNYKPSLIYGAVAGALGAYDLPDLAASLAPRELTMVNSVDAEGKKIKEGASQEDFSVVRSAYSLDNEKLQIVNTEGETDSIFLDWLK